MPHETSDGIPSFLIISQEERKAAWEKFRATKALPPETKPTFKPIIGDLPDVEQRP